MNHFLNVLTATVNDTVYDFMGNIDGDGAEVGEEPFEIWVSAISLLRDFDQTLFAIAYALNDEASYEAFLSKLRTKKKLIADICLYRRLTIQYCNCSMKQILSANASEVNRFGSLKAIRAKILKIEARYGDGNDAIQFRVNYSDLKYDGEWLVR